MLGSWYRFQENSDLRSILVCVMIVKERSAWLIRLLHGWQLQLQLQRLREIKIKRMQRFRKKIMAAIIIQTHWRCHKAYSFICVFKRLLLFLYAVGDEEFLGKSLESQNSCKRKWVTSTWKCTKIVKQCWFAISWSFS